MRLVDEWIIEKFKTDKGMQCIYDAFIKLCNTDSKASTPSNSIAVSKAGAASQKGLIKPEIEEEEKKSSTMTEKQEMASTQSESQ